MNNNEINEPLLNIPHKTSRASITSLNRKLTANHIQPIEHEININEIITSLFYSSFPCSMSYFFIFLVETFNLIVAGNYMTTDDVAAIGLGTFYINFAGFVIGIGLLGGIDTICSQAHGAKQFYLVGMFVNIAKITLLAFTVLVLMPLMFLSGSILSLIGIPDHLVDVTSSYVISLVPYVFFSLQFYVHVHHLQSIKIFAPTMYITLLSSALHPLWCWIAFSLFRFDNVIVIGLIMGLTAVIRYFLISQYVNDSPELKTTNIPFDQNTFNFWRIYDYIKISVPSAFIFSSDWLGFEFIVLYSTYVNIDNLASNVLLFNLLNLITSPSIGISYTTTSLTGNAIGACNTTRAKVFAICSSLFGFFISISIAAVLRLFKDEIPLLITQDTTLANNTSFLIVVIFYLSAFDSLQTILSGVIKAIGKQSSASIFSIMILFFINTPFSLTLAYIMNYQLEGLWTSLLCSTILLASSYLIIITSADWVNISSRSIIKLDKIQAALTSKGTMIKRIYKC